MFRKKMMRDIIASKVQFISIFILAFLGVFIYSGMRAQWEGMDKQANLFYESSALSDLFVMGHAFDETTLSDILNIPGVADAQLRLDMDIITAFEGEPTLRLLISDDNALSRPRVTSGHGYDTNTAGIWLDESFAHAHSIEIGERVGLSYSGLSFDLPVVGYIIHPEYVYNVRDHAQLVPDPMLFGYACVPEYALDLPFSLTYSHVLVALDSHADKDKIISTINDMNGVFHVLIQEDHASVATFEAEIRQQVALSSLFPILFFFVAALCMLTTMTRLVLSQRTLIGTFMGLGFSRNKILFHYMSYGLWIGLAGGLLGLFTGPPFISELLFSFHRVFYTLPVWRPAFSAPVIISAIASAAVCVLASYIACVRELKESPAAALRPKSPKVSSHTPLEKTRFWHSMSFSNKWNLRDIFRSRIRSIMAIAGVAGCSMMLVWGVGIYDSIHQMQNWYFEDLQQFDQKVYVSSNFDIYSALSNDTDFQAIEEVAVNISSQTKEDVISMRIFDNGHLIRFEDTRGQTIELPAEGASISYKSALEFGIDVGDTVFLRLLGTDQQYSLSISSIHRTPFEQGLVISRGVYEKMGLTMSPNVYLVGENAIIDTTSQGIVEIQDKAFLMKSFDQLLEGISAVVIVLFLAAVLLGCVILYNLGSLSFSERLRELATLRVLGFHLPLIRKLLRRQTLFLSIFGVLVGTPLGYFFLNVLTQTISDNIDFPSYIAPTSVFLCAAGTITVALITDAVLGRKAKYIDMVSALKSIE